MSTIMQNDELFSANTRDRIKQAHQGIWTETYTEYYDSIDFDKSKNFLLSQTMSTETGLRDLALRYITVILQVCLKSKNIKYSSKLIYQILKSVLPDHISMGDLGIETLNKYIKDIDINNQAQNYKTTFEQIQVYEIMDKQDKIKELANIKKEYPPYTKWTKKDMLKMELLLKEQDENIPDYKFFNWTEYYKEWKQGEVYDLYYKFVKSKNDSILF
ncbi:MAG: hypothetical protein ACRCTJ_04380 [Brevinema sp.]